MATLTSNLSLIKPAIEEFYDINVQNGNMDLLDTAVAGKADGIHVHPVYATCTTGASTKAKTVSLSGFTLVAGAMVVVRFANGNTNTAGATLNVNSTGAKAIYAKGVTLDGTTLTSGDIALLVYDGSYWQVMDVNTAKGKIIAGSYIGTGTYGSKNPTVVDFGVVPKMIVVATAAGFSITSSSSNSMTNYFNNSCIWIQGQPLMKVQDHWDNYTNYVTPSGTTLSWYHTLTDGDYPARAQLNESGAEYFYVAFG